MLISDIQPPKSFVSRLRIAKNTSRNPDQESAPEAQSVALKWGSLVILSLALAIIIIDTTLLNVSLSSIIRDLHTDIQSLQWVISAYSLTLAALTITGGRLGDLFGRKRMFVLGAIIFAIGSFITSISQNVPTMIIGEAIIEGIGAALMMPATSSLLVANFRGRERAIAFGVWGAIAAGSAALGPVLGGYLTTNYSWRWGFRINIVVAAILALGSLIIRESRDTKEKATIDWLGVFLSSFGLLSFVFGVIESSRYGWWAAKEIFQINGTSLEVISGISIVPFAIVLGIVLLGLFVVWEKHMDNSGKTPLVSMRLFQNKQFVSGAVTTLVLSLGQTGLIFSIPVFLQAVRGFDAYHTGLALLPMSLALLVVAPVSALLSHKMYPKHLIQIGLLVNMAAFIVLHQTFSIDATSHSFIPGLALFGIGMGLVMSQINNLTLSAVPIHEAGEASGVNNTFRQIGASLGSAIIGAVLLTSLSTNLSSAIKSSTVIPEQMKAQIASAAAKQSSSIEFGGATQTTSHMPDNISQELTTLAHQATVEADKVALIYGFAFGLLGLLVSFYLPKVKNLEHGQKGNQPEAGH